MRLLTSEFEKIVYLLFNFTNELLDNFCKKEE